MSGKNVKKKSWRRANPNTGLVIAIVVVLVLLLAVAAAAWLLTGDVQPSQSQPGSTPAAAQATEPKVQLGSVQRVGIPLRDGLELLDVGSYTGAFVEDGSDEVVSCVLMLKVVNNGEDAIEYARITMQVGDETAEFSVSTLLPGASVVLLEKNRMAYSDTFDYSAAEVVCDAVAVFKEPLSLQEDKLQIQILDGAINVTNISGADIPGKIRIAYKNAAQDVYYGGITYQITLEDGLKDGEIRQLMASHFSDTGSRIMFVTIAE